MTVEWPFLLASRRAWFNTKVISDGGYGAMYAVMATNQYNRKWHAKHAALCSVIEQVNLQTASFAALCINTSKFWGPPELQAAALMCIYHLVKHSFKNAPLYANGSGPVRWHWLHTSFVDSDTNISNSDYETLKHSNGSGSETMVVQTAALEATLMRTVTLAGAMPSRMLVACVKADITLLFWKENLFLIVSCTWPNGWCEWHGCPSHFLFLFGSLFCAVNIFQAYLQEGKISTFWPAGVASH